MTVPAVLLATLAVAAPARAQQAGVEATIEQRISVDEDRLWVTEFLSLTPVDGKATTLPPAARRYAAPPEAGKANRGGLRNRMGDIEETELVDGAVLLPAEIPAEGISAALEYSIAAREETAGLTLRHPFAVREVHSSATANVSGVRLSISGAPAGTTMQEGPVTWTSDAKRSTRAEAGVPVRVVVSGLPAYHVPLYAKAGLLLAAHLAGLSLLNLLRKRKKPAK
jgi:hypothetical protein